MLEHPTHFPDHVRHARWIDSPDKDWLSTGFSRLDSDAQAHALRASFHCQLKGMFVLERDDPHAAELLRGFMADETHAI